MYLLLYAMKVAFSLVELLQFGYNKSMRLPGGQRLHTKKSEIEEKIQNSFKEIINSGVKFNGVIFHNSLSWIIGNFDNLGQSHWFLISNIKLLWTIL